MIKLKHEKFIGANGRPSLLDLSIPENYQQELIIFIHGYMGFKDWGCWNLVEEFFTEKGFGFLKYNVSHNGCTLDHPEDFVDPEAFSLNTYSKELEDLMAVFSWLKEKSVEYRTIHLIGHSRGGGIAMLGAVKLPARSIITWAAIADIESRFPTGEELEKWKKNTLRFVHNGRTGQDLPLNYSQFTDFLAHKEKLSIEQASKNTNANCLIIHGEEDTSVSIHEGELLAQWTNSPLHRISNANHTFGSQHPWKKSELPDALLQICQLTLNFLESN